MSVAVDVALLEEIEIPGVAADVQRPVLGAARTLYVEDARLDVPFGAQATLVWLDDPLLVVIEDQTFAVVADALALDLGAWRTWGERARVGVLAPVYLVSAGDATGLKGPLLGDPGLELAVSLLARDRLALAALAGGTAPLGASARQLGYEAPTWHAGLAAQLELGRVGLLANVETRGVPETDLAEDGLDDALSLRAAGTVQVREGLSVNAELLTLSPWAGLEGAAAPSVELLVGAKLDNLAGQDLQIALGRGLTGGIGAPALRLVLAVGTAGASGSP